MERTVTVSNEKTPRNPTNDRSTPASRLPTGDITDRVINVRVLPGSREPIAVSVTVSKSASVRRLVKVGIPGCVVSERESDPTSKTKGGS